MPITLPEYNANLVRWIEEATDKEPILGVVIGEYDFDIWPDNTEHRPKVEQKFNVLLSWDEAKPMLDYTFNSGYGGADCNPVTAWTKYRVIFVAEYDGATSVQWLPRAPEAHTAFHV